MASIALNFARVPFESPTHVNLDSATAVILSTAMRPELQANLQRDFALAALREGVRVDGRALEAARQARITLGPAHGQAHVALGSSVALASAVAEPVTPYPDRPAEGTLSVSVEISAAASESAALEFGVHGANPPSDPASMALRGIVERVIRDSRALDTEALCILAGKKVWAVSVDVSIVDAAGNCVDAAHLAAMAALLHARRNDVSISGTDVHIHPFSEREPLPLPIHHVPLTVTYALFGPSGDFPGDIAAIDPSLQEELAADGMVTVALNAHGEVCGLHKAGGLPIDPGLVGRCARIAADRAVTLTELLNKALKDSTAKHHPLSTARPVLVAAEQTAILRNGKSKKPRSAVPDADVDDEVMTDGQFQGGASLWNAVPVDGSAPPAAPDMPDSKPSPFERKVGDMAGDDDDGIVDDVFRSAGRKKSNGTAARPKGDGEQASKSPPKKAVAEIAFDDEDSDSDSDSDADLMSAVRISKPKGGGARARSKAKR